VVFAGINYWAVLIAAAVGFGLGGVWYMVLSKPWMAAHGFTTEQIRTHHGRGAGPWPLIISFVADLIMAWMLAGVIGHMGAVTVVNGLTTAAFVWVGFVITTLTVNNVFGLRSPKLIWIDGGHWLLALLAMGAVIGAWGV